MSAHKIEIKLSESNIFSIAYSNFHKNKHIDTTLERSNARFIRVIRDKQTKRTEEEKKWYYSQKWINFGIDLECCDGSSERRGRFTSKT